MSRVYITDQNDMLDNIAFKVYGDESTVAQILDANPGLIDQPELLPRGIEIMLPDPITAPAVNILESIWA